MRAAGEGSWIHSELIVRCKAYGGGLGLPDARLQAPAAVHAVISCSCRSACLPFDPFDVCLQPTQAIAHPVCVHPPLQVLLPEAAVQQQSLALFGLSVPHAQLWRLPASRWRAQEDCAALPLWQLLGAGSTRTVDDPTAIDSAWGFPVLGWAPGSMFVAQCLPDGSPAAGPTVGAGSAATAAASGDGSGSRGTPEGQPPMQGDLAAAAAAAGQAAAAAALQLDELAEERPGSEEAIDAELKRQAERQQQQEAAARRLATAGALAGRLVNGVGGRLAQHDNQLQLIVTPDGEPAVGSHPGFEAGRVAAAFPATAAQLGCLPGDQLVPLIAQLAADELLGRPPQAVSAAAVALGREALSTEAVALTHDSWSELARCLAAQT